MSDPAELSKILFSPLAINGATIKNRIVMSPMASFEADRHGRPTAQTLAFLSERASGGVGMIILGGTSATRRAHEEAPFKGTLRFDDDRFVPDMKRVTDAVHAHGASIFVELSPGMGPMAKCSHEWPMIAASPKKVVMKADRYPSGMNIPFDRVTRTPREATVEEIRAVERDVAAAAARAKMAGFDGVEIPAIMSYLLASFLSPLSNWRTDEYGGSLENRARILVNIVRRVRQKVGDSYPVGLRILANQHVEGGQGPAEYAAITKLVEREGIDYVALVDGTYESMNAAAVQAPTVEHGEAQIFREALSCPLILGGIHSPQRAAEVINSGLADAVMLARPLLADAQYANKVRDGRSDDIVRCVEDNSCMLRMGLGIPVRCAVNPRMGRESRAPGERPPLSRVVKAPIEQALVSTIGSKRIMDLAAKVIPSRIMEDRNETVG